MMWLVKGCHHFCCGVVAVHTPAVCRQMSRDKCGVVGTIHVTKTQRNRRGVFGNGFGAWWGRQACGQSIIMDGTLQRVAATQED